MNLQPRRKAILFIIVAALLAIVLKDAIWNQLIAPFLYQLWLTWIFMRSMPQIVYWNSLVVLIAIVTLISLIKHRRRKSNTIQEVIQTQDPVAKVANSISDLHKGTFFKWLIANQLGTLARSILIYQHGEVALPKRRLIGRTWNPPAHIQRYLEAGLASSLINKPRRWLLFKSSDSPFDIDVNTVVEYLEDQLEIKSER
jgi:hypothetical protein